MLSVLGWLHAKLYEKKILKSYSLGVPTISVGNITTGGTGKTPLVAFVANFLAEIGENVCVISRGYKRENAGERVLVSNKKEILATFEKAGDEPFELAKKLLGKAYIIADAKRVQAGIWAREKFGITVFVLDDAFQHRKVKRDLEIVVIDATNPFGKFKNPLTGILREPLKNLNRADLIIITRTNLIDTPEKIIKRIREFNKTSPILSSENQVSALIGLKEFFDGGVNPENSNLKRHKTQPFLAFCGLGNPENFFQQLKNEEFQVIATKSFPDHFAYQTSDLRKLENLAAEQKADALLTTAKDAVKLRNLKFTIPCFVAENKLIFEDEKKLHESIHAVLKKN